ncbi:DedA family protein [Dendrosporobacter sp. 1207_IL3150]|uniref:DedA family protein n=1 Tax=Dendrosporobacter sp. 1207_IL3150 TaxID=3084054 RepID=UPI002FD9E8F9
MDFLNYLGFLEQPGYIAVFFGMLLEGACLPVPAELVLGYAGLLVSQGKLSLCSTITAAWLGTITGSVSAYWAARTLGRKLLCKYSGFFCLTDERIDMASRFFCKYGAIIIIPWRQLPVVRNKISIAAGVIKLPFWHFLAYTSIAAMLLCLLGVYLGYSLGSNWHILIEMAASFSKFIIITVTICVSIGCIALLKHYRKTRV